MMAKVLRYNFRQQATFGEGKFSLPPLFYNLSDITSEYGKVTDMDVAISSGAEISAQPPEYAYLAIAFSSSEWTPVCMGKYHNGTYHFSSLGANTLYMPVIYENGQQKPFNQPFFLTDSGEVIYFEYYEHDSMKTNTYPRWHNVRYKTKTANIKAADKLTGRWLFEDTANYGKATAGKDLEGYKMTTDKSTGKPSTVGLTRVDGPESEKNAVRIPRYSYFKCIHNIPHNGTGKNINEYTILMDIKLPERNGYCFLQTNMNNINDADLSLYYDMMRFGVSKFYCYFDPPLREKEWYRLVISAHLGESLKYYLNGELVFANYNTKSGMEDSDLSLSKEGVLLFADDSGRDNDIDVSEVAIFNGALSDEEVFSLGAAGNEWNITDKNDKQ
jgi:hypothetical protein